MAFCTQCGNRQIEPGRFCSACGAELSSAKRKTPQPAAAFANSQSAQAAYDGPDPLSGFCRIERKRLEILAGVIELACNQNRLSQEQYKNLHAAFIAYDDEGKVWSIGIRTRTWHTADDNRWVPGTPGNQMRISPDVLRQLTELEQVTPSNSTQAPPVVQPIQVHRRHAAPVAATQTNLPSPSASSNSNGFTVAILVVVIGAVIVFLGLTVWQPKNRSNRFRQIHNEDTFSPANPTQNQSIFGTDAGQSMQPYDSAQEFQLGVPDDRTELESYLQSELQNSLQEVQQQLPANDASTSPGSIKN